MQNLGGGLCTGLFSHGSSFTVELLAQHTIAGGSTVSQLLTGWLGAIPADY